MPVTAKQHVHVCHIMLRIETRQKVAYQKFEGT